MMRTWWSFTFCLLHLVFIEVIWRVGDFGLLCSRIPTIFIFLWRTILFHLCDLVRIIQYLLVSGRDHSGNFGLAPLVANNSLNYLANEISALAPIIDIINYLPYPSSLCFIGQPQQPFL